MGKLKNLKKLEKLKPYALWLNLQPKRLLALTSNDRRECITSLTSITSLMRKFSKSKTYRTMINYSIVKRSVNANLIEINQAKSRINQLRRRARHHSQSTSHNFSYFMNTK